MKKTIGKRKFHVKVPYCEEKWTKYLVAEVVAFEKYKNKSKGEIGIFTDDFFGGLCCRFNYIAVRKHGDRNFRYTVATVDRSHHVAFLDTLRDALTKCIQYYVDTNFGYGKITNDFL